MWSSFSTRRVFFYDNCQGRVIFDFDMQLSINTFQRQDPILKDISDFKIYAAINESFVGAPFSWTFLEPIWKRRILEGVKQATIPDC